jgi:hypothetical protein
MDLYSWNGKVSAALLLPLHICEVVTRNTVHRALVSVYGERWPWNENFELSLPNPTRGYNSRSDLINSRRRKGSTGKVIPELKFVFWQKAFTSRFDGRLWNHQLLDIFPNHPVGMTVSDLRLEIASSLESIRNLRNRIAHHEPIFTRDLRSDFESIQKLLRYQNVHSLNWMLLHESVTPLLDQRRD